MKDIYIVAAKRTPFGKYRGFFKDASAVDMGVMALKGTLKASGINPEDVQALFMGNVLETGLGENMARQVALYSGMKESSAAVTINEVCGSSLKAVRLAQGQMEMGDLDLVAVGGSESMTRAPYFINKEDKDNPEKMTSTMLNDGLMDAFSGKHMGITAENVAEKYNVSREEMDKFSLASHQKAAKATEAGLLKNEILDVEIDGQVLDHDEPTSFYFNQKAVFINNVDHDHSTWHKLIVFFTYRVISLIPDTLIMLVGLSWLHLNALLVKIIDQVLVGVFNYLTTRSVFQKQEHTMIERAKMRIQEQKNKRSDK